MLPTSDVITVRELNTYIKNKFAGDSFLSNLWLRGEISNFVNHSSGHLYFTLKDETSKIKGVMFLSNARTLSFMPQNGLKVIARGYVSVFERDGQYQFYAQEILPDGIGQLYLAYEQLKKNLEREGLFAANRKKALPRHPQKIAIITSPTGAAIRDIITTIERRYPLVELVVVPVLVQGTGAAQSIVKALQLVNQLGEVDLIITGRGGGSIEELWAFNEEIVARAIADSQIPVISAVGHETDYTIADWVADVRAATPTAAAELAVPNINELSSNIKTYEQRIRLFFVKYIENARLLLARLLDSAALKRPEQRIIDEEARIDGLLKRLAREIQVTSETNRQQLLVLEKQLVALSPFNVLNRGYAIVYNERQEIVSTVSQVKPSEEITVRLSDGRVKSVTKSVEEDKDVEN